MTWLDEHPEAVEAAAKALCERQYPRWADAWLELGGNVRAAYREEARAALAAALSAGPEPEYQWGVRNSHDCDVIPADNEAHARATHARLLDGYELVRWVKPTIEVVDD